MALLGERAMHSTRLLVCTASYSEMHLFEMISTLTLTLTLAVNLRCTTPHHHICCRPSAFCSYFGRQLAAFYDLVPWDGIWIDMNEASNFCTGDICTPRPLSIGTATAARPSSPQGLPPTLPTDPPFGPSAWPPSRAQLRDDPPWVCHLNCKAAGPEVLANATLFTLANPPYKLSNTLRPLALGDRAISVLATHRSGARQYDTHNLYGMAEAKAVHEAVRTPYTPHSRAVSAP
jgi:alpha-glucosidase (family GH31 glycosyl hydrolase)